METSNLFDLSGQRAVVIGGTGVLGGALAEGLARAGAHIAILGRNEERGLARVATIQQAGGQACFIATDATSKSGLETARKALLDRWSEEPSILINATGGNSPKATVTPEIPFSDLDPAAWEETFHLNLNAGVFYPCQVFGGGMVAARRGSIINIASVSAHLPLSRVVAYSAAKAAVLNLSQFLAREWAPFGVRVNTLTPGFFPAEQNKALLFQADGTPSPRAQTILQHTPLRRFGKSSELVGAAVFLASEAASSFVTGTDLRVDGGFLSQTI